MMCGKEECHRAWVTSDKHEFQSHNPLTMGKCSERERVVIRTSCITTLLIEALSIKESGKSHCFLKKILIYDTRSMLHKTKKHIQNVHGKR